MNLGYLNFFGESLKNRTPSNVINFRTPFQIWFGKPSNLKHLRVFFCYRAFAYQNVEKLEPKALSCLFIGYCQGVKRYRMVHKVNFSFKFIISRDVTFKEYEVPSFLEGQLVKPAENIKLSLSDFNIDNFETPSNLKIKPSKSDHPSNNNDNNQDNSCEHHIDLPSQPNPREIVNPNKPCIQEILEENDLGNYLLSKDRTRRTIRPPSRFLIANLVLCS